MFPDFTTLDSLGLWLLTQDSRLSSIFSGLSSLRFLVFDSRLMTPDSRLSLMDSRLSTDDSRPALHSLLITHHRFPAIPGRLACPLFHLLFPLFSAPLRLCARMRLFFLITRHASLLPCHALLITHHRFPTLDPGPDPTTNPSCESATDKPCSGER